MIKPLQGQRVLITREEHQAQPLAELIESAGGTACIAPMLQFEPIVLQDVNDTHTRLQRKTDWLFFTSSNTVTFFEDYRKQLGISLHQKIASVGEKTSVALEKRGYKVDFQPTEYSGMTMVREFIAKYGTKQRVTIICGENAREEIPQLLSENGVSFDKLVVYRTIENVDAKETLQQYLENGIGACLFTSPSTVKAFVKFAEAEMITKIKKNTVCVAIGKTTAEELVTQQFRYVIYPEKYTIEAMVDTLIDYIKDGEKNDRV
ncbi:uroporphyrinogen-III synthase [Gracilibacillus xinjiangensis]|uniref:Uroporphyrinogen-III synthase n=1 Tax=Gracilibacillus xinjiangensis TaxID=1193282 RepID=A0ABV8WWZ3_9BACI